MVETQEIWKDIKGFEKYEVSNLGRVRNKKNQIVFKPGKIQTGYLQVGFRKNGKQRKFLVHRLVAEAFVERKDDDKKEINHKNGDKEDNRAINLEWATRRENILHKYEVLHHQYPKGKEPVPVVCVETGKIYDTTTKAETELNIAHGGISHCLRGRYKTSGGYHWKRVNEV